MTVIHDLPDADYHSRPELSSTGARLLLPEFGGSPAKFKYRQGREYHSAAFDVGKAVHAAVLGVGAEAVAYPDDVLASNGAASTKAAKDWADSVRFEGKIPMKAADLRPITGMSEAVLKHPTARPIFEVCEYREVSAFASVDGVQSRARFDALSGETRKGIIAADLKTGDDATKAGFERSVAKWGYDVQNAFYDDVYEASEGRPIDEFYFVAVERSAPYEVAVFRLPELWMQMGKAKAAEARRIYQECTDSGTWPGYDTTIQFLDPPTWVVFEHEMRYEQQEIRI
jgi:exodeoxyribonuclease VIII